MVCISTKQKAEYDRRGILILEPFLPAQLLESVIADMQRIACNLEKPSPYRRIQDAWKFSDSVGRVADDRNIRQVLRNLYGREPLPFQTLNFDVPTQQPVHSDTLHFNSMPRGLMCGVWVALEDISFEQGPLIYHPGSHKLPEYTFQDFGLEPGFRPQEVRAFQARIADLIEAEGFATEYGVVGKGSGLIWAANLLHGGHEWLDKSLTRHSQVTHYFFEDCRYWRPGLSGDDPYFFEPEWISF